jgi:hypothetical protein
MAHLVLLETQADPLQNQKACPEFFREAIFCPRTYDENATIKLNLADIKNFKY